MQRPRLPFAVAATGPRGLRLAAQYGQAWVTTGDPKLYENGTPEQSIQAIRGQVDKLADACAAIGRDVAGLDRVLLTGFTPDRARPLESLDAFVDFAGRHQELGFTEIVVHWPIPDSDFAADEKVFEQIAMEARAAAELDRCDSAGQALRAGSGAASGAAQMCGPPHGRARICVRMTR